MAHADYHCCAICDRKMDYANNGFYGARKKEYLCRSCLKAMHERGVMVYDGEDVVSWIQQTPNEDVKRILLDLGYRMCHYDNPVDDAFCDITGVKRERGEYVTEEMFANEE